MRGRPRRRLIAAIIVLVVAALAAFAFGIIGGSSRDPLPLLATRPALPSTWIDTELGHTAIRIFWREVEGARTTEPSGCELGRGAIRGWSDGGDPVKTPDAFEMVCVYRTPLIAWACSAGSRSTGWRVRTGRTSSLARTPRRFRGGRHRSKTCTRMSGRSVADSATLTPYAEPGLSALAITRYSSLRSCAQLPSESGSAASRDSSSPLIGASPQRCALAEAACRRR
jgi:hypothetical protein